ncbi:hypothetical protein Pmani_027686 [Petrolisthes manimaculis]|uniref:G-protein coupled receptors family 2 profile 2 domain-containing protein n=1 Tax=Petrolisthes manimaculis TaxID=1843537 RepID=A0AAE1TYU6_9EUCA|nr:hypothetical protein Pmani_027686 [Petrolisthes manimaculis]
MNVIWILATLALLLSFVTPNVSAVDVDGGWTIYSALSTECTSECDGGVTIRARSCTNPSPRGSGKMCVKSDGREGNMETKAFPCNVQTCWVGQWSDWGNCSVTCGRGKRTRVPMCGNETCIGNLETLTGDCNTWDRRTCASPCLNVTLENKCPGDAVCKDISDNEDPKYTCVCTMGYEMTPDNKSCVSPMPTEPTPRPIPTLAPEQKVVATVISKTASTVLIICVSICLVIFILLRIFTIDRVIQMNMEIALLLAHVFLMFPPSITETEILCKIVSILIHFFFTACFMFMFLEALHMYGYIAYVVKKEGMCSRLQNTLVGWALAAVFVLFCIAFEFMYYGGEYHCWLQMNTPLLYGQLIPIIGLVILTFTLIEAAGAADYKQLKGGDKNQQRSAKFSQRTNLLLLPLVFSHMLVGMFSEYEQNLYLYGIFTILCSVTGVAVLLLHCANNHQVRAKMVGMYRSMCGR